MISLRSRTRARVFMIGAALLAGACGPDTTPSAPVENSDHGAAFTHQPAGAGQAEVRQWLAGLRTAIARFHRFEAATDAGYNTQITPCFEQPGTGGMGFHYGNPALIDGVVEEFAPELLLYEPEKNGRLRLVAVEYIVPFIAWSDPNPPSLHGLEFHANQAFQIWALHAWVERHNPNGMFADWNPAVTCAFAN